MQTQTRLLKDSVALGHKCDDGFIEARSFHGLCDKCDPFYDLVKRGTLSTNELIETAELDSLFYYSATQFRIVREAFHNQKLAVEQGVGVLSKKDERLIFNRVMVHAVYEVKDNGPLTKTRDLGCEPFNFHNDTCEDFFTIYAHRPENYLEALMVDHAVLCSIDPYEPNPVQLPENSVLGRVDGRIRAISFDELRTIVGGP